MTEVEVARLGRHGDGVSADGGVFAPLTLPGELVAGEVAEGRMEAPEVLRPSADRVAPPCPAFGACGGCQLMHASDAFVAGWKRDRIAEALASRGLAAELRGTATSPEGSRRRAVLSGRRLREGAAMGFHARRGARIVEIAPCRVLRPEIVAARAGLTALTALAASRKGEVKLAVTVTGGGLDVDLRGARPLDGRLAAQAAAMAGREGWARLAWEGEVLALARSPSVRFGSAAVVPPPGGFLQATEAGEAALAGAVAEAVGPARRVADLFAGCGTFALRLAETAEVRAVEADAAHLAALAAGWRAAGGRLKRVETETRDLFRRPLPPAELAKLDAVVLDPPRAGAKAQAEQLAASAVPRLAMVSCNPETFARDARALIDGGYSLDWVLPVDQFRWSAHVELAAQFTRR